MDDDTPGIPRGQFPASMMLLQDHGFQPSTFIDIGAAEGAFFLGRREVGIFPAARHFFVDAMQENEELYRRISAKFGAGYEIAAVSSADGWATLQIDPGFYDTHLDGVQAGVEYKDRRSVPMTTLDSLVARHALEPPFAVKLDVQGGELDALRGGLCALRDTVAVTSEMRLTNQRDTLVELLAFMKEAGWVLFDLTDLGYSPVNHTLIECYVTFIPSHLDFRVGQPAALPGQYEGIRERLRRRREANIHAVEELLLSF